jgi:hypothetical protein
MGGAPPPPPGAPKLSVFCIEIPYINFVLEFPIKRKRDLGSTLCEKRDLALRSMQENKFSRELKESTPALVFFRTLNLLNLVGRGTPGY